MVEEAGRSAILPVRPFKPCSDASIMPIYANPQFWRGAAAARNQEIVDEGDAMALVRLRTIERELRAGRPLADIPAFQEWRNARFKGALH